MDGWTWQITAASQAGTSHLRRGEECADALSVVVRDSTLILSVADGAGSAKYGAVGSAAVADISTKLAVAMLEKDTSAQDALRRCTFVRDVFNHTLETLGVVAAHAERILSGTEAARPSDISEALVSHAAAAVADGIRKLSGSDPAKGSRFELRDLHTTLLLAVLTEHGLSAGNIGDGWLVVGLANGEIRVVAPPAPAEYANETFFLDSAGALDDAVYEHVAGEEVAALTLMTDGPARFAVDLSSRRPSAGLLQKFFALAADRDIPREERDSQLAAFLASDRVCKCTDDDKTIVLAARVPADGTE